MIIPIVINYKPNLIIIMIIKIIIMIMRVFEGLNVKAHLKLRRIKGYDMLLLTFTPLSLAASNNMGTTGSLGGPIAKTSEQFSLNSMWDRSRQTVQEDTRTRQQRQHQL